MAEWFEDFTSKRQGSLIDDYSGAIKFGLKKIDDAVDFVTDKGKELLQPVDEFFGITEGKVVNGKQMPSALDTVQGLAEASYDVPYNAAKSLGAPEGVAIGAGVAGSLLEPSPVGEAKAATVAGELLSKTTKVVNKAPKGPPTGLQPAFATLNVQNGTVFYDGQKAAQDNIFRLTVKNPDRIGPGVYDGMAAPSTPLGKAFDKHMAKLDEMESVINQKIEARDRLLEIKRLRGLTPDEATKLKKLQASVDRRSAEFRRSLSTEIPESLEQGGIVDPPAYRPNQPGYELPPQIEGQNFDIHHLFPKGESFAYLERWRQLWKEGTAHSDDLFNMQRYARELGAVMGDHWSNLFFMHKGKQVVNGTTLKGPHNKYHGLQRAAGNELPPKKRLAELQQFKDMDSLMDNFNTFIIETIKPGKELAMDMQKKFQQHIDSLAPDDPLRAQLTDFLEQLRARGSQ